MTREHDMRPGRTPALQANGVTVSYGGHAVLRDMDLQVARGEIYALLGGNGAGKSTTLGAFLGLVQPAAGTLRVCDVEVGADPLGARAQLAYVPENVALYGHLSAQENIAYFLALAGVPDGAARIAAAIDAVGLDRAAAGRRLAGYSKGMRQKAAIALALARRVPVLLLDEPTSGLDPRATGEFNALLLNLRAQGVTIFMVTHDLLGAAEVADRIGFLGGGRIAAEFGADLGAGYDLQALYRQYAAVREAA